VSAFIVTKATIDYLVSAGLHQGIHRLCWHDSDPGPECYLEGQAIPSGSVAWSLEHRRELTMETAGRVGAMLWAENTCSVNWRYAESELEGPYVFDRRAQTVDPVWTLKLLDCYEYQSCEHPGWEDSEARRFCDALRHDAIGRLPGYEAAPWDLPEGVALFGRMAGRRIA
jgi:hypothetical protein